MADCPIADKVPHSGRSWRELVLSLAAWNTCGLSAERLQYLLDDLKQDVTVLSELHRKHCHYFFHEIFQVQEIVKYFMKFITQKTHKHGRAVGSYWRARPRTQSSGQQATLNALCVDRRRSGLAWRRTAIAGVLSLPAHTSESCPRVDSGWPSSSPRRTP